MLGRAIGTRGLDIIGVDPNSAMRSYAEEAFERSGLAAARTAGSDGGAASTLRVVDGVAEAIPLPDGAADAVVSTLTLCSVADQAAALAEVARVLKPRTGRFAFLEHVLSEDDAGLAATQRALTPLQVMSADGCHLDRRTLAAVRATAGFGTVDAELTSLPGFWYLSPTAVGVAYRS